MKEKAPQAPPKKTRRAPAPTERKLDPERSRRLLLDAAMDEFAEKGFAGARVQDIADRAGLNKQLISYYFGGKEGLYRELHQQWLRREETIADPALPLDDLIVRYLDAAFADPRPTRLNLWHGLTGGVVEQDPEDLSGLRRRQADGELADDLDPAAALLLFISMVSAPTALPHLVRQLFGVEPDSPEFRERYTEQVRRIVRHLA
ncbi:TetR family transcriptional regulator [Streptomyces sp. FXJ1.4098]|uniref:TetR/AcrR family transcriptional regulator n=1 Tax=Streptomyces sp. NPDC020845 TaxID=3365096 RepID=UPI0029944E21|nr:TetR family transcriptional regulator [Streptomyces sp. FXJ1.4098]